MSCQHDHPDDATCSECEFEAPTRNHFFTGKMMGAGEFQTEQDYHAEKMRHHNLRLHGWGVVCGLKVHQHPSMECHNRYVVIEPGSAIDCCGREIIVPHAEVLDVARHPAVERLREDPRAHTLQITLCYRECPTEEVPVLYDDCGCDEARCAPNRVLESYAFDIRVDPPLSEAACPEAAAAAFVSSDPSVGPRVIPAGANGVLPMIDPTDANRLQLLDTARSRRRTISLSAPVDAVVMSPDGEQVFAVSANATDNGPTFTVAVLDSEGGQINEVSATIDGVSASEVSLDPESIEIASAMVDGSNVRLVALDKWGGILHFIELSESQSDGHSINVGGPAHSLTLNADGSAAFVISENRVLRIELPPESATDTDYQEVTHHLGDSAEPVALTAFAADGVQRLAIAFSDAKVLIMNANADPTDAGANASLDLQLDHPPSLLYATADGSHLIACAALNGRINLQKIGNPAAPTPTVFATRTVESATPPILVLATAAGEVTRVDPPKWGDGGCNDLACETDDCSGCETPECLVLATLEGYRPNHTMLDADDSENDDSVRIDNRRDRRVLASTSKLQAWLRCLQHSEGVPGPQGPPGKDAEQVEQNAITKFNPTIEMVDCGKGPNIEGSIDNNEIKLHLEIPTCCDHKLNRISSINWNHAGKTLRDTIKSNGIAIGFEGPLILPDDHELLLKHCFIVEAEVEIEGDTKSLSSTAWTQLNGTYRVEFENGQPFSISFHRDSWPIRDLHVRIRLIGDLLKDLNGNAVDANHLPPWFSSGEEGYRTGNCIPGGTFYSWFTISDGQQ